MNKNIRFLSSVCILGILGMSNAFAVPSVKRLGANTARVGSNATVVKANPSNSAETQRLGTIRVQTPGTGTATAGTSTSRIGLGKYINQPVVSSVSVQKPSTGTSSPNQAPARPDATSTAITELTGRVDSIETNMESKQDTLTVGEGLVFENNNLQLDEDILDLPDMVEELSEEMDTKVSTTDLQNFYYNKGEVYNKEEVNQAILAHDTEAVNTVYDAATHKRKYVAIVDEFDEGILN